MRRGVVQIHQSIDPSILLSINRVYSYVWSVYVRVLVQQYAWVCSTLFSVQRGRILFFFPKSQCRILNYIRFLTSVAYCIEFVAAFSYLLKFVGIILAHIIDTRTCKIPGDHDHEETSTCNKYEDRRNSTGSIKHPYLYVSKHCHVYSSTRQMLRI